jgi:hypothetical protein
MSDVAVVKPRLLIPQVSWDWIINLSGPPFSKG